MTFNLDEIFLILKDKNEFLVPLFFVIYLFLIGLLNFVVIFGLWLWFKRPVYIYKLYKWYIFQKYKMKRSFVNVQSISIHIAEINKPINEKTSLLFIHGAGGQLLNWSHTIKYLDRRHNHIIFLDLPGHGFSFVPLNKNVTINDCIYYIRKSLIKIGLKNQILHVIGQSLGGYIAAEYAVKYTETVKLLTVMAPAGLGEVTNEFYDKIMKHDFSWIMPESISEIHFSMNKCMYRPPQIPQQLLAGILEEMSGKYYYLRKMLILWMEFNINGIFNLPNKIVQPTQIIWGLHDQLLPVENADLLKNRLLNCTEKIIIKDCGHSTHLEKPDIVAAAITDFRLRSRL